MNYQVLIINLDLRFVTCHGQFKIEIRYSTQMCDTWCDRSSSHIVSAELVLQANILVEHHTKYGAFSKTKNRPFFFYLQKKIISIRVFTNAKVPIWPKPVTHCYTRILVATPCLRFVLPVGRGGCNSKHNHISTNLHAGSFHTDEKGKPTQGFSTRLTSKLIYHRLEWATIKYVQ